MIGDRLNILLVDDMASAESDIREAFKLIGIETEIDYRCPKYRTERFGCPMPEGKDFDKYDLALIDLELFPARNPVLYEAEDLRGGTEILPYLRQEAPWLPVIAESRLFHSGAQHFLSIAGSFGFDGQIPRDTFQSKFFNRSLWDDLFERARELRRRAIIGENVLSRRQTPVVEVMPGTAETLDRKFGAWHEVVQTCFCFSTKVILKPLKGGFSGADVFKTYVNQSYEEGDSEGEWVWKVSLSPWKLHQEVQAHLAMLRAGLDYARMVPLLWSDVIVENRIGAIAYKFAEGTQEASEILKTSAEAKQICERLSLMFTRFYKDKHPDRAFIGRILAEWSPGVADLLTAASQLSGSEIEGLLVAIANGQENDLLGETIVYQRCRVHGDLHLGNIMLGSTDLFIDFARSKVGPIAVDAAKLISDLLLRLPELREEELPQWSTKMSPMMEILIPLQNSLQFQEGDIKLFDLFLSLFLSQALNYGDIPDDAKSWARDALTRQHF